MSLLAKRKMDMTKGSILPLLITFAIPILLSSILQQLFHSADTAVVGRFEGSFALAAVGSNSSLVNLFVNFFGGLALGANVVIARYIGMGRKDRVQKAVPTVILLGFLSGILLAFIGQFFSRSLLILMNTPEEVLDMASLYLRIYFLGMPFILLFNFGNAVLKSVGDTTRPLYALLAAGLTNMVLNILFVVVFHWGVAGVAFATVLSNGLSAIVVIYMLLHHKSFIRLELKGFSLDKETLWSLLKIGLPAGIQNSLFSMSNIVIQSSINSFGPYASAGVAAGYNFEHLSVFFSRAFAEGTVTFTSQNYGAKNYKRCKDIFKVSLLASMGIGFAFDSLVYFFRYPLLSIFTVDVAVLEFAVIKMFYSALLHHLSDLYDITAACLRGLGHSLTPTLCAFVSSFGFRMFWVFFIVSRFHSFSVLMACYPLSYVLGGMLTIPCYLFVLKKIYREEVTKAI